jgi:hypothetical protein
MDPIKQLEALGYMVSVMDAYGNGLKEPMPGASWSVLGPGLWVSGRVPKRKPFVEHVMDAVAKKEATQYESLRPLFERLDLRACSAYFTTYGVGVQVLFRRRDDVDEDRAKIADTLAGLGIEYRTEYSDAHWVYRFIISTKADNLARLPR